MTNLSQNFGPYETKWCQSDKEIRGTKYANELTFDWEEANSFGWMNLSFYLENKICAVACLSQMAHKKAEQRNGFAFTYGFVRMFWREKYSADEIVNEKRKI